MKFSDRVFSLFAASTIVPLVTVQPKISEALPRRDPEAGRRLQLSDIYPEANAQYIGERKAQSVAVGDANGDGAPDLVFGNRFDENELFLNDGAGNFPPSATATLPGGSLNSVEVEMMDFDNDGHVDVFVSNSDNNPQQLLLHDRSDNINPYPTAVAIPNLPQHNSRACHAVDIDQDGNADILIGNYVSKSLVLLGDGAGNFPTVVELDDDQFRASVITTADVNGDGHLDVVVGYSKWGPSPTATNRLHVHVNDGDSLSFTRVSVPEIQESIGAVAGDFNNDGRVDIAISNGRSYKNKLLLNNGNDASGYPTFTISDLPSNNQAFALDAADVNADGAIDIVVAIYDNKNKLLLNDGTGLFNEADVYELPEPQNTNPFSKRGLMTYDVTIGDLNGDSRPDLVFGQRTSPQHQVVLINDLPPPAQSNTKFPTSVPTSQPTTSRPTTSPSSSPTKSPTSGPSSQPTTSRPTTSPTSSPSKFPTSGPTSQPTTSEPTTSPTSSPTKSPTSGPSSQPTTSRPTTSPTSSPSKSPTSGPSSQPTTSRPTTSPSSSPTKSPTNGPSSQPTTSRPTTSPTSSPSKSPTSGPTSQPTTSRPTTSPSSSPTKSPTSGPSSQPTISQPTTSPTLGPSKSPTSGPSDQPTTSRPTTSPSSSPTKSPTSSPSRQPTTSGPTTSPTSSPTKSPPRNQTAPLQQESGPSSAPITSRPTTSPNTSPTKFPTSGPSGHPTTSRPTTSPTSSPTKSPTSGPSRQPTTSRPTNSPTSSPTSSPTRGPSTQPTTLLPSTSPTLTPTKSPTSGPSSQPSTLGPTYSPISPPFVVMWIPGNELNIAGFGVPPSPFSFNTMAKVLKGALWELIELGLGSGRAVRDVTIQTITGDALMTVVGYEMTVIEACPNEAACEALASTTTMYADLITHMTAAISSNEFGAILYSWVIKVLTEEGLIRRHLATAGLKKGLIHHEDEVKKGLSHGENEDNKDLIYHENHDNRGFINDQNEDNKNLIHHENDYKKGYINDGDEENKDLIYHVIYHENEYKKGLIHSKDIMVLEDDQANYRKLMRNFGAITAFFGQPVISIQLGPTSPSLSPTKSPSGNSLLGRNPIAGVPSWPSGPITPHSQPPISQTTDAPTSQPTGTPTSQPTDAPTSQPTDAPTSQPTGAPTSQPTGAPTTTPETAASSWTVDFLSIDVDFTHSSEDQLVMKYEIGKDLEYEPFLYKKDCATEITDVTVNSTKAKVNKNMTHDLLTLSYSIDKAAIANSSIWNATSSEIEMCQVVNLIVPATESFPKLVIAEDRREVDINFDLSIDYSTNNDLGPGTIEDAAAQTNVSSYVRACQCKGVDNFTCNSNALVPNTQLYVCIKSVSSDVVIDRLVSMVVSQGSAKMDVINAGAVIIPSIADMTLVAPEDGLVVSTFVPSNIFNYTVGASINVAGNIEMQLVGSTRKLRADIFGGGAFNADANAKAHYELNVELQDVGIVLQEAAWTDSSGAAVINMASALLGMFSLFASRMW